MGAESISGDDEPATAFAKYMLLKRSGANASPAEFRSLQAGLQASGLRLASAHQPFCSTCHVRCSHAGALFLAIQGSVEAHP
ncbi:hypothetical protein HaLaN_04889, partial [Haematococcus lacustris]